MKLARKFTAKIKGSHFYIRNATSGSLDLIFQNWLWWWLQFFTQINIYTVSLSQINF